MEARFRIRAQDGRVLEPRTMEIFAELVRSGVVRPEDEIHDALTGTWVPASRHPMVSLFQDPLVTHPTVDLSNRRLPEEDDAAEAAVDAVLPPGGPAEAPDPVADEETPLTLDLVSVQEESPEEAQRAFIEKMEAERLTDPEPAELAADLPLVGTKSASVSQPPSTPPPQPAEQPREEPVTAWSARDAEEFGAPETEGSVPAARAASAAQPRREAPARRWRRVGTAAVVVALPLAVVAVSMRLARPALGSGEGEVTAEAPGPRAPRPVPRTEAQIREEAHAVFLGGIEAIGAELEVGTVPDAWLEGFYLADPGAYPEVRAFWERYLAWLGSVRDREVSLYREAYLDAAERAGISGPVRSLRMASAAGDFEARRPGREEHYARVWELAAAALALDDLVTELHGRITYEPIRGERLSADPVIEAAGRDPEAQARLEAALDRVLLALHGPTGGQMVERARIAERLVEGLR